MASFRRKLKQRKTVAHRSIQLIFNKIIESGFFSEKSDPNISNSTYMCIAAAMAVDRKVINWSKWLPVKKAIDNYLQGYITLRDKLKDMNLPHQFADRLKIYQNWHTRPFN